MLFLEIDIRSIQGCHSFSTFRLLVFILSLPEATTELFLHHREEAFDVAVVIVVLDELLVVAGDGHRHAGLACEKRALRKET